MKFDRSKNPPTTNIGYIANDRKLKVVSKS